MPTVTEIVDLYPIALYLSVIDINKKGLSGGGTDINLPEKIYSIGESVKDRFTKDPTDETLTSTANFLYAIMGKYAIQAQAQTGSGGSIAGVTSGSTPVPYNFIVDASTSFMVNGENSKTISSFIGYNLLFARGGIVQSTINTESSYYSWDKTTGAFTCTPALITSELILLAAI